MYLSGLPFCFMHCPTPFYGTDNTVLENFFDLEDKLLRKYNPRPSYVPWRPSTALPLSGYFLFLPAILSFLFSSLSLQRVCIQSTSSSSQSLFNLEKLSSCPILTVRYKSRHPERLQSAVPLWFELKQFWYGNKEMPLTITSWNFNPQTVLKEPFSQSYLHISNLRQS